MIRRVIFAAAIVAIASSAGWAQIFDSFTYPDGNLTTVSGGIWKLWSPTMSGDATVVSGQARLNDTTDVNAFFTNVFKGGIKKGSFSFDIKLTKSNSSENYEVFLGSSSDPGVGKGGFYTNTNYQEGLLLLFDKNPGSAIPWPGKAWVGFKDLSGAFAFTQITVGKYHHIHADMTFDYLLKVVNYVLSIDGYACVRSHFKLLDPRGLNSVEFATSPDTGMMTDPNAFAYVDNVKIDPPQAGDTNEDFCVNDEDLINVILDFGDVPSGNNGDTDLDADGVVSDGDLLEIILHFGEGCGG